MVIKQSKILLKYKSRGKERENLTENGNMIDES